jgi:hypothetical protein
MSYLIWSEDHGGWRGPGEETGYVSVISAAGRYTLEQARVIYEQNNHHAVMVLAPEDSPGADPNLEAVKRFVIAARWAIDSSRELLNQRPEDGDSAFEVNEAFRRHAQRAAGHALLWQLWLDAVLRLGITEEDVSDGMKKFRCEAVKKAGR